METDIIINQYKMLKAKHPDALILFRCRDFYETYCEDAQKASEILGITMTRSTTEHEDNGSGFRMAIFPYHALDTYLPKLIRNNVRVAICDQICEPKKVLKRRGINELENDTKNK